MPTLITAAVFTPARIVRSASGSSTRHSRVRGGSPSAAAVSRNSTAMPLSPACVLRTIGSRLYRNSAAIAGRAPIPNNGIMNTNTASDGSVCSTPVADRISWPSRGRRAATTPSGSATTRARPSDTPTSARCSRVRCPIRAAGPRRSGAAMPSQPAATSASVSWPSFTRALSRCIVTASMRPARPFSAATQAGARAARSAR